MCPDDEQLLQLISGNLEEAVRAQLDAHVDVCSECRLLISALVRETVPPPRFGRYVIETVIGGGGMGIVYRAFDPELKRPVAIKVVTPAIDDENLRARLFREAQSLARLSHPNVCQVHDVGKEQGEVWVAMELIDGIDLRTWAFTHSLEEVMRCLLDAARGISAAHNAGLIHRDIKPENVLVTQDGRAIVTDFGLAQHDGNERSTLSAMGRVGGTPAYLAPEQLTGATLDARVDQFAWAVMTWELMNGTRPFPVEPVTRLAAIGAGLAPLGPVPALSQVLIRALALATRDRFASMDGLLLALQGVSLAPRRKRRVGAAALALLLVPFMGAFWLLSSREITGANVVPLPDAPVASRELPAASVLSSSLSAPSEALSTTAPAVQPAQLAKASEPIRKPKRAPSEPREAAPREVTSSTAPAAPALPEPVAARDAGPPDAALPPPAPPPTVVAAQLRPSLGSPFNAVAAENQLAVCRFPVNPNQPEPLIFRTGQVVDWGRVTRREILTLAAVPSPLVLYEIAGYRETYRINGGALQELGVLDVNVGDLVVVCPYARPPSVDLNGLLLPPHWSNPSRPIYKFAPAAVEPRVATELRDRSPLHLLENEVRLTEAGVVPPAWVNRTLMVWARASSAGDGVLEMEGWRIDARDLGDLKKIRLGRKMWWVVDGARAEGSPASRYLVAHGVRVLPSMLR